MGAHSARKKSAVTASAASKRARDKAKQQKLDAARAPEVTEPPRTRARVSSCSTGTNLTSTPQGSQPPDSIGTQSSRARAAARSKASAATEYENKRARALQNSKDAAVKSNLRKLERKTRRNRLNKSHVWEGICAAVRGRRGTCANAPASYSEIKEEATRCAVLDGILMFGCPPDAEGRAVCLQQQATFLKDLIDRLPAAGRIDLFRQSMREYGVDFSMLLREPELHSQYKVGVIRVDREKALALWLRWGFTDAQWTALAATVNEPVDRVTKYRDGGTIASLQTLKDMAVELELWLGDTEFKVKSIRTVPKGDASAEGLEGAAVVSDGTEAEPLPPTALVQDGDNMGLYLLDAMDSQLRPELEGVAATL